MGDPGMEFERRGGEERRGEGKRARRLRRSRGPPPQAGRQRRRPPEAANGGGLDGGGGIAPESPGRATRGGDLFGDFLSAGRTSQPAHPAHLVFKIKN